MALLAYKRLDETGILHEDISHGNIFLLEFRAKHIHGFLVLGSDVDASYLDEIQGIESLMLVPALVGTRALVGMPPC